MAEPIGPKFDLAPVKEPPPAVREEGAHDGAVHPSTGKNPVDQKPAARQEAADAGTLPPGEPPANGNSLIFEAVAELWSQVADVDPITYYWEEPSETRGRDTKEGPEEPPPVSRTRRSLYKRSDPAPSAEDELANVIAFLQRLRVNVRRVEPRQEPSSSAEGGLSVLQSKRLARTGVTPDPFQVGGLPKAWSAPRIEANPEPAAEKGAPPPETPPAPPPEGPTAAKPARPARPLAAWLVLTSGLCLAAYLWTRIGLPPRADAVPENTAQRGKHVHPAEAQPPEEALNLANLAVTAIQQGDLKKASDLLDQARKQGAGLQGLLYQAALLAFSQGQPGQADKFLDQSIAANEAVADCWYLRANASFSSDGPDKAAEQFEQAIYADPFNPRHHFFRAECLRRNGHPAAALEQFQQALRRRPSSTDTELILFKIGLTRLESNTDLIFKTELRDHLAHEPVSGDTLLLAAADAIGRNKYAEAADALKRATVALPPRAFQVRIRDYVFQSQAQQPDLAPVLKPNPPTKVAGQPAQRAVRVLVDPATRSLGEADPAGW